MSISEWENKVINTGKKKNIFVESGPKKRILCMVHVFLGCWTAFDDRFYVSLPLKWFNLYLPLKSFIISLADWITVVS